MASPENAAPIEAPQEGLDQHTPSSKDPSADTVPEGGNGTSPAALEKYKVKVELFKWLIGTVGLTIITYIINWGFKDREQGIVEIKTYDKYASESVVYAINPRNRMLLAEFFANVTPSEKLRAGWRDYLKIVKVEVDSFNNELKQTQVLVAALAKDTGQSATADADYQAVKRKQDELEKINNLKLADDINQNENVARNFEMIGFGALLARNIDKAIYNFKMSENSYNGYHMVYDIGRYLEGVKTNFSNDDAAWKNIYQEILRTYSWRMPVDIKIQLVAAAK